MDAPQENDGSEARPEPSFQFSLKTMFLATTGVAVGMSLLFAAPRIVNLIAATCFFLLLPAVLTVVLVYGRGYQRTFCIGALFPAGLGCGSPFGASMPVMMTYGLIDSGRAASVYHPGVSVAVIYAFSMLFGVIAIGIRRRLEWPQST